jgi:hypothetical protein
MREIFKYGSVGGALGDRRIYPEITIAITQTHVYLENNLSKLL